MKIVLFRHGPAGQRDSGRWPDDRLRPLTPRGVRRTRLSAAGVAWLEPQIDVILTSPLLRALATAELLKEQAEHADFEMMDSLEPGRPSPEIIELLAARPAGKTLALVGHEPDLGQLAGHLMLDASVALGLKKAGACAIEFTDEMRPGTGTLTWFLPPRALRRLGRKKVKV
jgi:phosphohistidine phosphatase